MQVLAGVEEPILPKASFFVLSESASAFELGHREAIALRKIAGSAKSLNHKMEAYNHGGYHFMSYFSRASFLLEEKRTSHDGHWRQKVNLFIFPHQLLMFGYFSLCCMLNLIFVCRRRPKTQELRELLIFCLIYALSTPTTVLPPIFLKFLIISPYLTLKFFTIYYHHINLSIILYNTLSIYHYSLHLSITLTIYP